MMCSGCGELKYKKDYWPTEWKKWDTPDQDSVRCRDCRVQEEKAETEAWEAATFPCAKCTRRFGTLQGLHAHEEGCKLKVEKERHAVPEPAKPKGGIARAEEGMQAMPVNRRWGRRKSADPALGPSASCLDVLRVGLCADAAA